MTMDIENDIVQALNARDFVVPPLLQADISAILPEAHHAVLAFWHQTLPDGRTMLFMADEKEVAHKQRLRTQVNLQIFPRSIVLLERHRAIPPAGGETSFLDVVVGNGGEGIQWESNGSNYTLYVSELLWQVLAPSRILNTNFESTIGQLEKSVPLTESVPRWHLTVDAGRFLRQELEDKLRFSRRRFLDEISGANSGKALLRTALKLTPLNYIREQRNRHFPHLPSNSLARRTLSLATDFEILEDFVSFLQGLRCYAPDCNFFHSEIFRKDSDRAIALFAAYPMFHQKIKHSLNLKDILNIFITDVIDVSPTTCVQVEKIDDPYLKALESALSASGGDTLNNVCKGLSKEIFEKKVQKSRMELLPLAKASLAMAARLAREHGVHEGRELEYSFLMGVSAFIWPEIEETLSEETPTDQKVTNPANSNVAELVAAHWSIFQFERVFGFIEITTAHHFGLPIIGKVIKVRPPVNWSGLYSQMARHLAQHAGPCFVIHARGTGKVVLYYRDQKTNGSILVRTLSWDTQRNVIDIEESKVAEVVQAILTVAGGKKTRFEEVLRSAIEEVSDARGEGAMLVVFRGNDNGKLEKKIDALVREMDCQEQRMAWRDQKRLEWMDKTLLRAMLILDGATILYGKKLITPRVVVYPHLNCPSCGTTHAFSVIDLDYGNCTALSTDNMMKILKGVRRALAGKGSKHHGAANLSVLLFKENKEQLSGFEVATISADGPIRQWPQQLLRIN